MGYWRDFLTERSEHRLCRSPTMVRTLHSQTRSAYRSGPSFWAEGVVKARIFAVFMDGRFVRNRLENFVGKPAAIEIVQLHKLLSVVQQSSVDARNALAHRREALGTALDRLSLQASRVDAAAGLMIDALQRGGRILVAGNGGSAAEAQHFAAELTGRFLQERPAYSALALTADAATLTAIANDYGFEQVFARQVAAHGRPGDLFVGFSTSGESENLIRAARTAREIGIAVVAITGCRPNLLAKAADVAICVPATETALIQELHTVVLHILCGIVESAMVDAQRESTMR